MPFPAALLMIATSAVALACCLAAGRRVPWQGRQSAVVMSLAMTAMALVADDERVALGLAAVLVVSAMLGTGGLRGRPAAAACCHRALGSIVMALCALGGLAHAAGAGADGGDLAHSAHVATGVLAPAPIGGLAGLTAIGVLALTGWTIAQHVRPHTRPARLAVAESWAMTAGVAVMSLAH